MVRVRDLVSVSARPWVRAWVRAWVSVGFRGWGLGVAVG